MAVILNNMQDAVPVEEILKSAALRTVENVLTGENYDPDEVEVSLVFVGDDDMSWLNMNYRGIDAPTDVLSFALQEGDPMPGNENGQVLLGDVVISLQTARRQSIEYGHSLEREVAYLAAHGTLHLLGYDHRTERDEELMSLKAEKAVSSLGLNRK